MAGRLYAKVHYLYIGALTKYGFSKRAICLDVDGTDGLPSFIEATDDILKDPDIIACLNAGVLKLEDAGVLTTPIVDTNPQVPVQETPSDTDDTEDENTDESFTDLSTLSDEQKALFNEIDNAKAGSARVRILELTDVVLLSELAVHAKRAKVQAIAKDRLSAIVTTPDVVDEPQKAE